MSCLSLFIVETFRDVKVEEHLALIPRKMDRAIGGGRHVHGFIHGLIVPKLAFSNRSFGRLRVADQGGETRA